MTKEVDLEKEKRKVFLMHLVFSLIIALIIAIIVALPNMNKIVRIEKFIDANIDDLQKLISNEIDISQMKDKSLIKNVLNDCNEVTCFTRFDTGSTGLASNTCYRGFYYSEKDIMHKFEYTDRIIEGEGSRKYQVKEEIGDNVLYLTEIREHWYHFENCY